MRYLLDTNVLLRGLGRNHPHCRIVRRALIALRREGAQLCLVSQNLFEFWAVSTRPQDVNGLGMSTQWTSAQLVKMKHFFLILPDTPDLLAEWERLVMRYRVIGKNTHDARLVAAMNVHGIWQILTFNRADFSR